jgi:predicted  nucleic acid-binding Zn-ribbon protein
MSRSHSLYLLQQLDTGLDNAQKRIQEINNLLKDSSALDEAIKIHHNFESIHADNLKSQKTAEHEVALQNAKLDQNQQKLYSGAITNPKELEDLQLESNSLKRYLQVLEERQLEAMLASDQSQADLDAAAANLEEITQRSASEHKILNVEKNSLESELTSLTGKRTHYLDTEVLPDLPVYQSLRGSSGGIAVTLMVDSSCSSCGASIPSAIEQAAKSPAKLAFCPTCKRILHPG